MRIETITTALDLAGVFANAEDPRTGLGWLPANLLGTLTAVGGGAARDLMLQRVPAVFGGNALYASVAVLVASIQVLCTGLGEPVTGTITGVLCGVLLRLAACRRDWRLPTGLDWQPRRAPARVVARSRGAGRQRRTGSSRGLAACRRAQSARHPG